MNNAIRKAVVRPIRFHKLEVGSKFRIFAEPTRTPPVAKSHDNTVYVKEAESYSLDTGNTERAIILYPEDLVVPLTRGKRNG